MVVLDCVDVVYKLFIVLNGVVYKLISVLNGVVYKLIIVLNGLVYKLFSVLNGVFLCWHIFGVLTNALSYHFVLYLRNR